MLLAASVKYYTCVQIKLCPTGPLSFGVFLFVKLFLESTAYLIYQKLFCWAGKLGMLE